MLSAVAARKSRLQQQTPSGTASPSSRPTSPPVDTLSQSEAASKPTSKRKASNTQAVPRRKKSKPSRTTSPAKDARYFQTIGQDQDTPDLIIIDDEDSDQSSDSSEESAPRSRPRRAWSPSAVPDEPDMDDDMSPDANEDDFFATPARKPQPPLTEIPVLSTFTPLSGTNFFSLTQQDLRDMCIQAEDSDRPACIILLAPLETLALLGTYKLTLLRGSVSLSGVTLRPSSASHHVFAPRCAPIPVIQCLSLNESEETASIPLPERLGPINGDSRTVVLLEDSQTGVEGLGKVCRTFDDTFYPPRSKIDVSEPQLPLRGVHVIKAPSHGVQPHVMPESWEVALSSSVPIHVPEADYSRKAFLVKGAKKTGKSTFARTLANRLSTQYRYVAFLECDLGQSEFTPGGMVALNVISKPLFGPPFTHPSIPYQSHYIGSTSPQSSPSHYLIAIQALIHSYNTDLQHASYQVPDSDDGRIDDFIPLVVNMMGWTKGLGADLSDRVEDMLQPSAVFEFEAPVYEDSWATPYKGTATPHFESAPRAYTIHRVSPVNLPPGISAKYSPADMRQLSILSYFHAVFLPTGDTDSPESPLAQSWNTTLPLCAQLPYEVSCATALDLVVLTGPGSEDVVPSEIHRVLNGALVALVSCEPGGLEASIDKPQSQTSSQILYIQGASPPPPTLSTCHGLALVRSISPPTSSSAVLQLLTPLPPHILAKMQPRVIVKGDMELPVWGMLDFRSETHIAGVNRADVSYLKWGTTDAIGATKRRTRRNLMRKGQM